MAEDRRRTEHAANQDGGCGCSQKRKRINRRAGSNDTIFWTGTVNGDNTDNSWIVNENGGNVNNGNGHQSNDNRVACVP